VERFTYKGDARFSVFITQAGGAISIVVFTAFAIGVLVLALRTDPPYWDGSCLAIWMLMIGWLVGLSLINTYPTVWLGDKGLVVSTFPFGRVLVPWAKVVDVGAGRVPFGSALIRTRRLTLFHRIYGWQYSRTLHPSFLVRRDIEDYDRLLSEIRRRAYMAHVP
jgi:hypothetical protein